MYFHGQFLQEPDILLHRILALFPSNSISGVATLQWEFFMFIWLDWKRKDFPVSPKSTEMSICLCKWHINFLLRPKCRCIYLENLFQHSHKKPKDGLEGGLYRVMSAAKLEFPKILVPSLPQNTSNVNINCVGKSKSLYSLCDEPLGALITFILLIVPGGNCAIHGCYQSRTTPGASLYRSSTAVGTTLLYLLLVIGW